MRNTWGGAKLSAIQTHQTPRNVFDRKRQNKTGQEKKQQKEKEVQSACNNEPKNSDKNQAVFQRTSILLEKSPVILCTCPKRTWISERRTNSWLTSSTRSNKRDALHKEKQDASHQRQNSNFCIFHMPESSSRNFSYLWTGEFTPTIAKNRSGRNHCHQRLLEGFPRNGQTHTKWRSPARVRRTVRPNAKHTHTKKK